jgi:uncharacterized protein
MLSDMAEGVEIVEEFDLKKGAYSVVTGFAGAGFVGNTALMFTARTRGFRVAAQVRSHLIPPMMILIDGRPMSSFRIYTDMASELLFIITEGILSSESVWPIAAALMEWFKRKGVKEIVSIEGLPLGVTPRGSTVLGFTTGERSLSDAGIQVARNGAVSGLNASLLEHCINEGIDWTSLFTPTSRISSIDYGGAANVIEVLNRMFNLGVDVSPLKQSEEMIRKMIEKPRKRGLFRD